MIFFSMFHIVNLLLKKKQMPHFILVVWSALVVGG